MSLTLRRQYKKFSFLLVGILCFTLVAGAALVVPVPVLALSAGGIKTTIASIVISLLLQCGVGIVDETYLNKLNNAYGVESQFGTIEDMVANGLLVDENGTLNDAGLEAAIQNVPEYEELFLGDMFSVAEGAAVGVAAGSGAHNIMTAAINCGTLGTIGAFAGAASIGVGLGVLLGNVTTKLANYIKNGRPLTTQQFLNSIMGPNDRLYKCYVRTDNNNALYTNIVAPVNTYAVQDINSEVKSLGIYGLDKNEYTVKMFDSYRPNGSEERLSGGVNYSTNKYTGYYLMSNYRIYPGMIHRSLLTSAEYTQLVNGQLNIQPFRTSYMTGPNGNQFFNYSDNSYPGLRSMVPEGSDMIPVDMEDYLNYVNTANNNYANNIVDTTLQGTEFTNFVNDHIVDQPEVPSNPEDIYNPTIPDSSNPTIPDQPTMPIKPDITIADRDNSLIGSTEGLQNVFPFCIPFDIYDMVTGLTATRAAPSLHVPVGDGQYLDVDLSDYETAASILRALELIAFIVGLAVATRSLIGAKG